MNYFEKMFRFRSFQVLYQYSVIGIDFTLGFIAKKMLARTTNSQE